MIERVDFQQLLATLCISLAAILQCVGAASNSVAQVSAPAAVIANSDPLASLPARLAEQYPKIRSLVLARGGCVAFEYYKEGVNAQSLSPVRSVTKSVLSILVGIAISRGYLRLDQKISEVLPEALNPAVEPRVRDISIRDLLTMTSGFDSAPFGARAAVPPSEMWQWSLYRRVQYPPGVQFHYDDEAVNLLSVVLTHAIKQNAQAFAEQNLFGPLGITNFNWLADKDGYLIGADTLALTARDMAKIGLLYLRGGRWRDRQIVSDDYVADSTAKHHEGGGPTRGAGYGYLWWVKPTRTGLDAFFASGEGSQLIYVVPKLDLVVAMAGSGVTGGSVGFVDDVILPAASILPGPPTCVTKLEP
jgi:CubicO group peptidase (beta-lactamase class C family)